MSLLEWNDSLKVGHARIDADHHKLVDLLNRLYEAMNAGKGATVCTPILAELISYTQSHFAMEEALMKAARYPKLAEHKAQHTALINDVLGFKSRLESGSPALTVPLFKFLKEWLSKHILGSDRELASALKLTHA